MSVWKKLKHRGGIDAVAEAATADDVSWFDSGPLGTDAHQTIRWILLPTVVLMFLGLYWPDNELVTQRDQDFGIPLGSVEFSYIETIGWGSGYVEIQAILIAVLLLVLWRVPRVWLAWLCILMTLGMSGRVCQWFWAQLFERGELAADLLPSVLPMGDVGFILNQATPAQAAQMLEQFAANLSPGIISNLLMLVR